MNKKESKLNSLLFNSLVKFLIFLLCCLCISLGISSLFLGGYDDLG